MSVVGAFPGFKDFHRKTVRAPVNPMDKSTIVSIYPREIIEVHHTIQPGRFTIPAGTYENPGILVVGPSSWWKEIDEEQPLLEIPNSSVQVADAIVNCYCNGLLACNMGDAKPGIFWVPGEFGILTLKLKHKDLIDEANVRQKNWYLALVKMADALWARSNSNPLAISNDMKLAAENLNLTDKEWLKDFTTIVKVRCFACGSLKDANYPVCPTCRAVDKGKAAELGITFAQQ